MSQAYFDPKEHLLILAVSSDEWAKEDEPDEEGRIVIAIKGLVDGIEVIHDEDRLWRLA